MHVVFVSLLTLISALARGLPLEGEWPISDAERLDALHHGHVQAASGFVQYVGYNGILEVSVIQQALAPRLHLAHFPLSSPDHLLRRASCGP